jgi:excisionase family DNA binding protein
MDLKERYLCQSRKERAVDFLSVSEAAALVGKSPRTVRCWIEHGAVDALKIGRWWVVDRTSLIGRVSDGIDLER